MSSEQCSAEREEDPGGERLVKLAQAREMLSGALAILDASSRSAAAAHVDLAIHLVEAEIAE